MWVIGCLDVAALKLPCRLCWAVGAPARGCGGWWLDQILSEHREILYIGTCRTAVARSPRLFGCAALESERAC